MKRFHLFGLTVVSFLILSMLIFSFCEKKQDLKVTKESEQTVNKTPSSEKKLNEQADMGENFDKLLKSVIEKQKKLEAGKNDLDKKLAELEAQLDEVESQLKEDELKFNKFRWITYVIFIIGLVCIITGLLMVIFRRRPQKTIPAPEVIPEKEANEKKTKKSEADKTKANTETKPKKKVTKKESKKPETDKTKTETKSKNK